MPAAPAETPAAPADTVFAPAPAPAPAAPAEQGKEAPEKPGATETGTENAAEHAAASVARKRTPLGTEHVQGPRDEDGQGATGRTGASGMDARDAAADASARVQKGRVRARRFKHQVGVSGVDDAAGAAAGLAAEPGDEDEEDEDDAAPAADADAAALEKLRILASRCADMAPSARRTQFMEKHKEFFGDFLKHAAFTKCVAEIVKKMMDPDKRHVAAKPDSADALAAALTALVVNPESSVIGAISDAGSSFRVDADSPFAVAMSWVRASDVHARFDPKEIGKSEGEGGKILRWLPWARYHKRGMCSLEKCATYVCAELLVKMWHNASSGTTTFRDDVSFHAVDLCAALTEREETFVESKSADGGRTFSWLKAPDGWKDLARELTPTTLGAFLADLDGYPVIMLVSKAVIVIAREFYENEGWSFEMWPDELIACAGVNPLIMRLDGSKHRDGVPAYGVGQVSQNGRFFLVACVIAASDAMYGPLAPTIGGPQYGAAHLTATVNVLISVCTNGELVGYDDEERCAFVANRTLKAKTMRKAVGNMMSGEYVSFIRNQAKKAAATRHAAKNPDGKYKTAKKAAATTHAAKDPDGKSKWAKKAAAATHAAKDPDGKSKAGKKAAATRHAAKDAMGMLTCVYKEKNTYLYKKRVPSGKTVKLIAKRGFVSELAAAVALNDRLASLSLTPMNEGWFNAEPGRKEKWKEAWKRERAD